MIGITIRQSCVNVCNVKSAKHFLYFRWDIHKLRMIEFPCNIEFGIAFAVWEWLSLRRTISYDQVGKDSATKNTKGDKALLFLRGDACPRLGSRCIIFHVGSTVVKYVWAPCQAVRLLNKQVQTPIPIDSDAIIPQPMMLLTWNKGDDQSRTRQELPWKLISLNRHLPHILCDPVIDPVHEFVWDHKIIEHSHAMINPICLFAIATLCL